MSKCQKLPSYAPKNLGPGASFDNDGKLVLDIENPELQALYQQYTEKLVKYMLSTEPIDFEKAKNGVERVYQYADFKLPRVLHAKSPVETVAVWVLLATWWENAPDEPATEQLDRIERQIQDLVREGIAANQTIRDICLKLAERLNFDPEVVKFFLSEWSSPLDYGRYEMGHIGWIMSFKEFNYLDVPEFARVEAYRDAAEGCWRLMHERFCVVTDTARRYILDAQGRPHCSDGPAHYWDDGVKTWFIDGNPMSEKIVMHPKTITLDELKAEDNVETRRVMINQMGLTHYLEIGDFKKIDADVSGGSPRQLLRDSFGEQYMQGSDNSTGRFYFMPVSPEAKTCSEAHASISGVDDDVFVHQS